MTTTEEQQKPKRRINLGWALGCVVTGVFCLAALRVDAMNNWNFGLKVSHESAIVMLAAAFGVAIIPVITPLLTEPDTWMRKLCRYATLACVIATGACAYFANEDGQSAELARRQGRADTYQSAKTDEAEARAEAKKAREDAERISETGSVSVLEKMVAGKEADKATMTAGLEKQKIRCDQSRRCRALDVELTTLNQRLADAKAKRESIDRAEKADSRVRAAQDRAKAGPVHAGAMGNTQALAVINLLSIGVTLLFALFGELSAECAKRVVSYEQPKPTKRPAAPKKPEPEQPREEKKSDLQRAVEACFEVIDNEAEEWMSPEKALNRVHTYYDQHYPKKAKPTKTALGTAMGEKGAKFPKGKVNGQQRYGVRFTKLAQVA